MSNAAINGIQHNLSAMFSDRQLGITTGKQAKSSEKLASGYRINRAADDAAGLSISEKMRRQIRGLQQGTKNVQDGVSLLQIADGALAEVTEMLQRLNELSVKAANGTLQSVDRAFIQNEVDALVSEIDRVGASTTFNERTLFHDLNPKEKKIASITSLVTSPSADAARLKEAYLNPDNNRYYPAATMDFSKIDASNVGQLDGKGFSFTCAQNCDEVFKFTFDRSTDDCRIDGSQTPHFGTHDYVIGIKSCKNGIDVLDAIFGYASAHPMGSGTATATSVPVSHSNTIVRTAPGVMTLWGNTGGGYADAEGAKNHSFRSDMGAIDCSSLTKAVTEKDDRNIWIQAGTDEGIGMNVVVNRMNGEKIGVKNLDVSTQTAAQASISRVKNAIRVINTERASLGAQQNRLEHTIASNNNTVENTMYSESVIRDTDMSEEMVRYSNNNILQQAGQSMLAQANQSKQGILTMLS